MKHYIITIHYTYHIFLSNVHLPLSLRSPYPALSLYSPRFADRPCARPASPGAWASNSSVKGRIYGPIGLGLKFWPIPISCSHLGPSLDRSWISLWCITFTVHLRFFFISLFVDKCYEIISSPVAIQAKLNLITALRHSVHPRDSSSAVNTHPTVDWKSDQTTWNPWSTSGCFKKPGCLIDSFWQDIPQNFEVFLKQPTHHIHTV